MKEIPLLVILGATASGKTSTAIQVALELGGEIISADSMQIYRGLDVGTAKPTPRERAAVPHHLVDVVDPGESFSVAIFQRRAYRLIKEIHGRGRLPLLVGGTGLYIRAVTEGWAVGRHPPDPCYREKLREIGETRGSQHLHRCLSRLDPQASTRIDPADLKRIIRALEIFRSGVGDKAEEGPDPGAPPRDPLKTGLFWPREELYRRIEDRVDMMMEAGWLEEVRELSRQGLHQWVTSSQALGYGHLASYLRGEKDLERALREIKRDTRRFAKRQLTWFRREKDIIWVQGGEGAAADIVRVAAGKWPELTKG